MVFAEELRIVVQQDQDVPQCALVQVKVQEVEVGWRVKGKAGGAGRGIVRRGAVGLGIAGLDWLVWDRQGEAW